ncbi:uncharacterized protein LOC144164801 [Haemaphysalis longicornis]
MPAEEKPLVPPRNSAPSGSAPPAPKTSAPSSKSESPGARSPQTGTASGAAAGPAAPPPPQPGQPGITSSDESAGRPHNERADGLGRSGVSTMPDRCLLLQFAFWSAALLACSAEPRIVPYPSPWPAHANFAVAPKFLIDDVPGRLVMLDSPILGCLPRLPCRDACNDPWKTTNSWPVTSHSTRLKGLHAVIFFSGLGRSGVSTMPDRCLLLQFAFWSAALLPCSAEPRIVPDPSPWPAHASFAVPPESLIDDVPGRLVILDSPILGCLPRSPYRDACNDPWKTTNSWPVTSHSTRLKGLHPGIFFSGLGRSGVNTMPDRCLLLQATDGPVVPVVESVTSNDLLSLTAGRYRTPASCRYHSHCGTERPVNVKKRRSSAPGMSFARAPWP